jgi:hypothetical protein
MKRSRGGRDCRTCHNRTNARVDNLPYDHPQRVKRRERSARSGQRRRERARLLKAGTAV